MVVPEYMKLNKFVDVLIPEPSVIYARSRGGLRAANAGYSGDEEMSILDGRKTDIDFEMTIED